MMVLWYTHHVTPQSASWMVFTSTPFYPLARRWIHAARAVSWTKLVSSNMLIIYIIDIISFSFFFFLHLLLWSESSLVMFVKFIGVLPEGLTQLLLKNRLHCKNSIFKKNQFFAMTLLDDQNHYGSCKRKKTLHDELRCKKKRRFFPREIMTEACFLLLLKLGRMASTSDGSACTF